MQLIHGDSLERLASLSEESVDSVVTDPPAGISFMGKSWDANKGGRDEWIDWLSQIMAECLRVLKPGGHALVWALPRTSHWTATAIENAGFEVRDVITHHFGTGFPKSLDVSKAIDKVNGEQGRLLKFVEWMRATGLKQKQINAAIEKADVGSHYLRRDQPAIPTPALWKKLRPLCGDVPAWVDKLVERIEAEREVVGMSAHKPGIANKTQGHYTVGGTLAQSVPITAPATESAHQWQGFGTALKPSAEMWILARKPLIGTVASNVLEHGTGALNIDGCRIGTEGGTTRSHQAEYAESGWRTGHAVETINAGRWPANAIFSGEAVEELDRQSLAGGMHGAGAAGYYKVRRGYDASSFEIKDAPMFRVGDKGGASRFFYCPKAPKKDRGEGNTHPTVKNTNLMAWLCRLITPPGGTILDPFMGSGSTGVACLKEGFDFIGIERELEYFKIAEERIQSGPGELFQQPFEGGSLENREDSNGRNQDCS